MSYLLDTNVVSELRKGARGDKSVAQWIAQVPGDELFLSVLVVGEIRRGIDSIFRRDPRAASSLEAWLGEILETHRDRVLPVDLAVAEEWGRLTAAFAVPAIDGLLAATAKVRGLTFVTRNVKDVAATGVSCLDPFIAAG